MSEQKRGRVRATSLVAASLACAVVELAPGSALASDKPFVDDKENTLGLLH